MIVVSNTSPLNYLVLIGTVDLLNQLFGTISIPSAVQDELFDPATPNQVRWPSRSLMSSAISWPAMEEKLYTCCWQREQKRAWSSPVISFHSALQGDAMLMDSNPYFWAFIIVSA